jgi:class 3 adenylate cyclase
MPRLQRKDFSTPDETRRFPNGRVEIYDLDDIVIGRTVFEPGWRWSTDVKPIAGTDWCEYRHVGVVLNGVLHVEMNDGLSVEIGADAAYEIPAGHDAWVVGDEPWVTIDFAGMRAYGRAAPAGGDRTLGSILFTDIVDSTATLDRLGDAGWRDLVRQHNEIAQNELDRYHGRLIKQTGDGILAVFDSAERGVRAAAALSKRSAGIGVVLRAGIHTGEFERTADDVRGVAVHIAARVMALAAPNEILISGTTHDLLVGSGLEFVDRGQHELKGLSGARQVFALVD